MSFFPPFLRRGWGHDFTVKRFPQQPGTSSLFKGIEKCFGAKESHFSENLDYHQHLVVLETTATTEGATQDYTFRVFATFLES
jgi:hypothetical protein